LVHSVLPFSVPDEKQLTKQRRHREQLNLRGWALKRNQFNTSKQEINRCSTAEEIENATKYITSVFNSSFYGTNTKTLAFTR
jgi:hypothetical protein